VSKLSTYLKSVGLPGSEPLLRKAGWDVQVAQRDGKDCAVVISKGTEIHFVSLRHKHAMTRKNTLAFLEPIFAEWKFVTTKVPIAETDHRLREILGFRYQWRCADYTYWALFQLPFQKAKP
jgi:hypothetical protein